jgi:hypothetical protein
MPKPELSDAIFRRPVNLAPLFNRFQEFSSAEAWDWYIRGMPEGESQIQSGLIPMMKTNFIEHTDEHRKCLEDDDIPDLRVYKKCPNPDCDNNRLIVIPSMTDESSQIRTFFCPICKTIIRESPLT